MPFCSAKKGVTLRMGDGSRCMHLYFYHLHPIFGLMHLRLQTWFPFQIEICLNRRAWLARQMDRVGLSYQRQDNRVRERIRAPMSCSVIRHAWRPSILASYNTPS
jgi:hypothetical protein